MLKSSAQHHGMIAKLFHWTIALLIIGLVIVGFVMTNMSETNPYIWTLFDLHKATGLVVFVLVAMRLLWRYFNEQPRLLVPHWQRVIAKTNIVLLYTFMFLMPLSGFFGAMFGGYDIHIYGLFVIPAFAANKEVAGIFDNIHEWSAYLLIAAFVLHVCGSLFHHFILRDNVLKRMWI